MTMTKKKNTSKQISYSCIRKYLKKALVRLTNKKEADTTTRLMPYYEPKWFALTQFNCQLKAISNKSTIVKLLYRFCFPVLVYLSDKFD